MIQMNILTKQKQTQGLRTNMLLEERSKEEWIVKRVCDWHVPSAIFKMDNQQRPTVLHGELSSMLCNNLNGKRIWKRIDTCICIIKSLYCPPETITTLLINYTLIKNKVSKKGWCIMLDQSKVSNSTNTRSYTEGLLAKLGSMR